MKRACIAIVLSFSLVGLTFATTPEVSTSVIDRAATSVYRVHGLMVDPEHGPYPYACTAFLVTDEHVMSAAHCAGDPMWVAELPAKVATRDTYLDIAVFKVAGLHGAPLMTRMAPVVRFESVVAMGYAYGWQRLFTLHTRVYFPSLSPAQGMAPGILVKPGYIGGMSGGPLIDVEGLVVGIIQASNPDMGYGVSAAFLREVLASL